MLKPMVPNGLIKDEIIQTIYQIKYKEQATYELYKQVQTIATWNFES